MFANVLIPGFWKKWPGSVCWKIFKIFKADITLKQFCLAETFHSDQVISIEKWDWHEDALVIIIICMIWWSIMASNFLVLSYNDIMLFNINTCIKKLDTYCTCINSLQINREKRTHWIKEHLHRDLKTYYHYQWFMGRYQVSALKEWNAKGNFILLLLVYLSLCLITFVCSASLFMIIVITV